MDFIEYVLIRAIRGPFQLGVGGTIQTLHFMELARSQDTDAKLNPPADLDFGSFTTQGGVIFQNTKETRRAQRAGK